MKKTFTIGSLILGVLMVAGCTSSKSASDTREQGPDGTVAYYVQVETSEPGARIEANGEDVGPSPVTIKIFGDKDGTFHNFGRYTYEIRAYPVRSGQYVQTKVFRTGGWFTTEDQIPKRIFFELGLPPSAVAQSTDVTIR